MSATLPSKDATAAQAGAREFKRHLLQLREDERSPYDKSFTEDDSNMRELNLFCEQDPPTLLWRRKGAFRTLFTFLAVRFLTNPDNVLRCEGIHAQWGWLELMKLGLSFKVLNAILKIQDYVNTFGGLPDPADLVGYINAIRAKMRMQL